MTSHEWLSILPLVLLVLVSALITTAAGWRILVRAGHRGAWSLLLMVPLVNIAMLYVFAFARWPVEDPSSVTDVFQ